MKLGTLGSPRSQIGKNQKPGGFKKLGRGFSPNLELYRIRGDFQDLFLEKMETCTPIEILIHIFPFQIWWMLWSSFFQILRSAKQTSPIQNPSFQPGFLSVGFEHDLEDCQGPELCRDYQKYLHLDFLKFNKPKLAPESFEQIEPNVWNSGVLNHKVCTKTSHKWGPITPLMGEITPVTHH